MFRFILLGWSRAINNYGMIMRISVTSAHIGATFKCSFKEMLEVAMLFKNILMSFKKYILIVIYIILGAPKFAEQFNEAMSTHVRK
jgi:hypothetical protein